MYKISDLKSISIEELISYSKQKESPTITVIDDIRAENFNYIVQMMERLRLLILRIDGTNQIAFFYCSNIALKIAKVLKKRAQVMYYDFAKRPKSALMAAIPGYSKGWEIIRDNGYIVKAYDAGEKEIDEWLNTNIEEVPTPNLSNYSFKNYSFLASLGSSRRSNEKILQLSRYYYLNDGVFNEKRQCYYPSDLDNLQRNCGF